jgi:hypothetical protein
VLWRHRVILLLLLTSGCASAPTLEPIPPQRALVGVELAVRLRADADGSVDFGVDSDLDLRGRRLQPTLTRYAGGTAVFRWIPLAGDVGDHTLRFSASSAGGATTTVEVPVSVGSDAAPLTFREPAGAGTTLDLRSDSCVEIAVVVEDGAAGEVALSVGADWPAGATLTQETGLTGRVRFCPSPEQAAADGLFALALVASDAAGNRAEKRYRVVVGLTLPPLIDPCARAAPWIGYTPAPVPLPADGARVEVVVTAAQAVGAVTSYWTADEPAAGVTPDRATLAAVPMEQSWGGAAAGVWGAAPPPSLTALAPGTSATVYYLVEAYDGGLAGCAPELAVSPEAGGLHALVLEAAP